LLDVLLAVQGYALCGMFAVWANPKSDFHHLPGDTAVERTLLFIIITIVWPFLFIIEGFPFYWRKKDDYRS
jgi:hypothetical protein